MDVADPVSYRTPIVGMATVTAAQGSLAAGAVESDEGFLGIRQDHPARHHRAQRGREDGDDAELEDGDAPTDGALPHGDAAVEVRGTGDRQVGRAAVAVSLAQPGGQRGTNAMVVDANGVVMVPPLARPGRRCWSANQPARCRSSRDRLRRVVDGLRDGRVAAVLELMWRNELHHGNGEGTRGGARRHPRPFIDRLTTGARRASARATRPLTRSVGLWALH